MNRGRYTWWWKWPLFEGQMWWQKNSVMNSPHVKINSWSLSLHQRAKVGYMSECECEWLFVSTKKLMIKLIQLLKTKIFSALLLCCSLLSYSVSISTRLCSFLLKCLDYEKKIVTNILNTNVINILFLHWERLFVFLPSNLKELNFWQRTFLHQQKNHRSLRHFSVL